MRCEKYFYFLHQSSVMEELLPLIPVFHIVISISTQQCSSYSTCLYVCLSVLYVVLPLLLFYRLLQECELHVELYRRFSAPSQLLTRTG